MIRTRFTERFGVEHPLLSAPMALHSGGTLAGAVSAAGGLGTFGGVKPGAGPDWIHAEVARIREVTDGPYAVGFITAFLAYSRPLFDAVLEVRPAAVALSFGDPTPWIAPIHDAGAAAICQVQTADGAALAVDAGADVLVVQGNEAGGHTGTLGLLPFLADTVRRFPDVVVLAAGGIGDGRGLAAALLEGADGAWVGTVLLATPEAVEVGDEHKRRVVGSDGSDTVFTRVHDIVSGLPWPEGIGERLQRDALTDAWTGREVELVERRKEVAASEIAPPYRFGPAAAFVTGIRPAGDVIRSIVADAEAVLRSRPGDLLA